LIPTTTNKYGDLVPQKNQVQSPMHIYKEREFMPQVNVTYLGGYLARDPELRYVGENGTALCQFSLAHTRSYKRGDEWQKAVSYVDAKCWGTTAERAASLSKGDEVVLSGQLRQERWTGSDGSQRSRLVLIADKVDAIGAARAKTQTVTSKPTTDDDLPF
jgi:single-strand DNA-binding protein